MLFEKADLPRSPFVKRMRVADAGESGGVKVIQFRCPYCSHDTGWLVDRRTISENKRGIPCPVCNKPHPENCECYECWQAMEVNCKGG